MKCSVNGTVSKIFVLFVLSLILLAWQVQMTPATEKQVLTIAGSRSMLPVIQEIVNSYMSKYPNVVIDVQGIGSSAGIKAIKDGVADIGMSSRYLKEEEKSGLLSTVIAFDAVAIIVHPDNKISNLTTDQARDIFAGTITNWNDVGQNDRAIVVIDKEAGSGTKVVFEELLMGENVLITPSAIIMDGTAAARYAVASDLAAIGYISLASVNPEVKAISLDSTTPSIENVQQQKYNLVMPFVLVTNENPPLLSRQFIEYVLNQEGQKIVEQVGLIKIK